MARSSTSFKKGQSGNPNGRPKLPKDLKEVKELRNSYVKKKFAYYLDLPYEEIVKVAEADDVPALDKWVATVVAIGIKDGDDRRMNFMLDRTIGKVTEKVEIDTPKPFIYERLDGSVVEAGVRIEKDVTPKELPDGEDNS